jgi:hypothetical protein
MFTMEIGMMSTVIWDLITYKSLPKFWRNVLPPSSGSDNKSEKQAKKITFFEASVNFYQTAWYHILENSTAQIFTLFVLFRFHCRMSKIIVYIFLKAFYTVSDLFSARQWC